MSIIQSPLDYFRQRRAAGDTLREAFAAQKQKFGSRETQIKTFGAPAERRALFAATSVSQLRFSTPLQAVRVARTQGLSLRESLEFTRALPRKAFGQFTPKQEFSFALFKSPEAQSLRQQVKAEAIAAGITQAEAVSLSFAAARQSLGFQPLSGQQTLIERLQTQGISSGQASQDTGGVGGNGTGGFGGFDFGGFGGGGGGGFDIGGQQGIGGGIGILLLLGLVLYESGRKKR